MDTNTTQYNDAAKDLSAMLRKPAALHPSKAPTGKGATKGDLLVQRLATEFKHDPIAELIRLASEDSSSNELKYKINSDLLGYYMPKLKAVELNQNAGETISVNVIMPKDIKTTLSN
jgi:hypothetical protein